MKQKLLTSAEVADIINVNVSTVKRWTDNGQLKCTRTPGKHRKYEIQNIIDFAENNSIEISTFKIFSKKKNENIDKRVSFAIYTEDYESLARTYYRYIFNVNKTKAENFLKILYISKIPLEKIFDNVIAPSLKEIGEQWHNKKVGIEREHLATNIALHSVIKLQDVIKEKKANGLVSICGCLENESHNIAITCINILLEAEGWQSYLLGNNTPAKSIIESIIFYKPRLVCISSTFIKDKIKFTEDINSIYEQTKINGSYLAVSGASLTQSVKSEIKFKYSPASAAETLQMIKIITAEKK